MSEKLRVGVIGAGHISNQHIKGYLNNPNVELYAICDANPETAKKQADTYHIPVCYPDYQTLLCDESITAVSVATPTFTHKDIVIEALKAGKHVICEKPPALNAAEAEECEQAALNAGKVLMYAFVVRFTKQVQFLKDYIDSGAMGDIVYAEATRMGLCSMTGGWFADKEKSGGGCLMDAAIHQLDAALYLMGYPKVKSVRGFETHVNSDLPTKIRGLGPCKQPFNRTAESFANGHILFENGACMYIKSGSIINTLESGGSVELCGESAGAKFTMTSIDLVSIDKSGYFLRSTPNLADVNHFQLEIDHFVDCCTNGTECICTLDQAVEVMRIITAIYESAQTGKEINF